MASSKKVPIDINKNTRDILKSFKDNGTNKVTYDEIINFFINSHAQLKKTAKGETRATIQLAEFLLFGHDNKITPYELRKFCGCNQTLAKRAIEARTKEVEEFNKQF